MMSTEKNSASAAPIPAPPVTPAVPGPPTPAGGGAASSPSSGRGKKKMMLIGILVGVLIVLVIAGVVAIKVANSSRTPEAEVRKYLDLLAAGKASAATAMVDPGAPNDQRVFLTDDVMASATSLLVVEEVAADKNEDAETRQVSATLQVNGERFTHAFTVTKEKPTMGVLNNWTVKGSLAAPASVHASGYTQFTVGGVSADAPHKLVSGKPATYLFYPGVYTFTPVAPSD